MRFSSPFFLSLHYVGTRIAVAIRTIVKASVRLYCVPFAVELQQDECYCAVVIKAFAIVGKGSVHNRRTEQFSLRKPCINVFAVVLME